jgi:flavin-dependent dehydrogenase
MKELGLPFPIPIPQVQVEDVRMVYGSRTVHVRGRPQFTVFHRAELDAYLAARLVERGGVIRQDEPVQHIQLNEDGALLTTPRAVYRARLVVGADGARGVTRRLVKRRWAPSHVARTLEQLTPAMETAPLFNDHCAVFDFSNTDRRLQGYLWDFPSRKNGQPVFNRGIYDTGLLPQAVRPDLPRLLTGFLSRRGADLGQNPFQGHPIHMYDPFEPLSAAGLLLVGDAAGIDPLLGEGISPALAFGRVAADAIEAAFRSNDFSLKDYGRRVFLSEVGGYLSLRWLVAYWVYSIAPWPALMHAFWTLIWMLSMVWPDPPPLY